LVTDEDTKIKGIFWNELFFKILVHHS
jgi:hypothetical protein